MLGNSLSKFKNSMLRSLNLNLCCNLIGSKNKEELLYIFQAIEQLFKSPDFTELALNLTENPIKN